MVDVELLYLGLRKWITYNSFTKKLWLFSWLVLVVSIAIFNYLNYTGLVKPSEVIHLVGLELSYICVFFVNSMVNFGIMCHLISEKMLNKSGKMILALHMNSITFIFWLFFIFL